MPVCDVMRKCRDTGCENGQSDEVGMTKALSVWQELEQCCAGVLANIAGNHDAVRGDLCSRGHAGMGEY